MQHKDEWKHQLDPVIYPKSIAIVGASDARDLGLISFTAILHRDFQDPYIPSIRKRILYGESPALSPLRM